MAKEPKHKVPSDQLKHLSHARDIVSSPDRNLSKTLRDAEDTLAQAVTDEALTILKGDVPSDPGRRPLTAKQELVAIGIASGLSTAQLAESSGMSCGSINNLRKRTDIKERVRILQLSLGLTSVKKRFDTILPTAIETAQAIMNSASTDPSTRARIAFEFINRSLGKPTQPIEQKNSTLNDLLSALDAKQSPPPVHKKITPMEDDTDEQPQIQ